ncbi:piggyBac transposable element-derived protein 4-like isoform X2 [Temnothorax longispinosus]|uniref:piggyBac transposable element-derived protein 4-like isoform X2 n=1 Tax=Temnothorax longispinosus TaxID=300112 RepID=UPI003A99D3D1
MATEGIHIIWFQEETSDNETKNFSEDDDDCSDIEPQLSEHFKSDPLSDSAPDNEDNIRESQTFVGKDNTTIWTTNEANIQGQSASKNITNLPGTTGPARSCSTPIECWDTFFTTNMIDSIVECTNVQLSHFQTIYKGNECRHTTSIEIRALLGILYMTGIFKRCHLSIDDLWTKDSLAPPFFRIAMSKKRFQLLIRALRFDNAYNRDTWKKSDKLAPMREVFEMFTKNCRNSCIPSEYLTIDEMFEAFRGKCSFKQYVPNISSKCGIKIFILSDARTFYTINMEIYAGEQPESSCQAVNKPNAIVKRLIESVQVSGRNITFNNWFVSIPLAQDLLKKQITVVGALRKNKRQIPPEFTSTNKRAINSSLFAFTKDMTLVSYVPKRERNILLLSTMRSNANIDVKSGNLRRPEIISFYNATKGGVNKLKMEYSVARTSRRWPLTIFFTLLNIAGINGQIIYKSNTNVTMPRQKFLKIIARDLVLPFVQQRLHCDTLSIELKTLMTNFVQVTSEPTKVENTRETGKCFYCPKHKNRKTKVSCNKCHKLICGEHKISICIVCNLKEDESE